MDKNRRFSEGIQCRRFGVDAWTPNAIRPATSCLLDCRGTASPAPRFTIFLRPRPTGTCSLESIGSTTVRYSIVSTFFIYVTLSTVVAHRLRTVATDLAPTARERKLNGTGRRRQRKWRAPLETCHEHPRSRAALGCWRLIGCEFDPRLFPAHLPRFI